jgi:SAM-dependent methyltransferase
LIALWLQCIQTHPVDRSSGRNNNLGRCRLGVTLDTLRDLHVQGLLAKGKSVLDFGPSNLYAASVDGIREFAAPFGVALDEVIVQRLADGSAYGPSGGRNDSFAGELLERVGIDYHSIDIAKGYKTTIVDLNIQPLPREFVGAFDTVLNLGTTEHIFNQMACFQAIHDATKVGGYIMHQLPVLGWMDHCYFIYTGRFFFDLAGYNDYELVSFKFSSLDHLEDMFTSLRSYRRMYPPLDRYIDSKPNDEAQQFIRSIRVPSVSANVLYRKKHDRPFLGALERSTSIGHIPDWVAARYSATPLTVGPKRLIQRLLRRIEG